jgi:hypothetical protein
MTTEEHLKLLDTFAVAAMGALAGAEAHSGKSHSEVAGESYRLAEAMVEARKEVEARLQSAEHTSVSAHVDRTRMGGGEVGGVGMGVAPPSSHGGPYGQPPTASGARGDEPMKVGAQGGEEAEPSQSAPSPASGGRRGRKGV